MFKLHDKTRRLLTLSIFLLLGPALLLIVLGKVCSRHSIRTVAGWETLLTDSLGKAVEIESVAFPAPGVVRFSQMRILDPETGETLAMIPQWELIELVGEMPQHVNPALMANDGHDGDADNAVDEFYDSYIPRTPYRRGLAASIGFGCSNLFRSKQPRYWHCEIPCVSCFETLVPQAKDVLLNGMSRLPQANGNGKTRSFGLRPVVLFVGEIDIVFQESDSRHVALSADGRSVGRENDSETIKNACLEFRPTTERTDLHAIFHIAGQATDAEPHRLHVSRTRQPSVATRVQWTTGDAGMAAQLPAHIEPFFDRFGTQSRFTGTVTAEYRVDTNKKQSRSLELKQASFSDVSLDSFLNGAVSFRLTGSADTVRFHEATFRGGVTNGKSNDADSLRLEYARGEMLNARGMGWWPGLRQLIQGTCLFMSPQTANPPDTDITFRDGTFAFLFDSQGIRLLPEMRQGRSMPLLAIDNRCTVHWPDASHVIRYGALLGALAHADSPHIPLMTETQYLLSTLPISLDAMKTANDTAAMPSSASPSSVLPTDRHGLRELLDEPSQQQHLPVESAPQQPRVSQPVPQHWPLTPGEISSPPQMETVRQSYPYSPEPQPVTIPTMRQMQQHDEYVALQEPSPDYRFLPGGNQATGRPVANQSVNQSVYQPSATNEQNPGSFFLSSTESNASHTMPASPYDNRSFVAGQTQSRVVIPHISANQNQVQTSFSPGAGFDGDAPTFTSPFDTQLARARQTYSQDGMTSPQTQPAH